ncbi:RrF2 family transcriptional regulator [Opitutus terrae]|uniref:Transcriptional regulator, BadM/Rrf2 family n=1 Tax=Opitutus terrae (strain DSM 11246 / JCM 15787 / PB90-1) TaxID=452637 RepID=B1ZMR4_OPITP|nr:Rrf2 family transcriptional regulator [Opitutus terrae]ACB75342.1 transcriptional regulator, BadM/Rrf2 family [Opitutus terrae PB90-1]
MKLSKKGEYALRSLINLGIAAEMGRKLVQVSELADYEQLPVKFLEQIMQALKDEGFVVSVRGKFGGYRLAKPAKQILIGQVVRLIDGPLAPIGCVSQTAYVPCTCPDETHCGLRMLMLDVRNAIANILDRYSLADVVEVTLRKLRRDQIPAPFSPETDAATHVPNRLPARYARKAAQRHDRPRLTEADGVLHQLLGDYTI